MRMRSSWALVCLIVFFIGPMSASAASSQLAQATGSEDADRVRAIVLSVVEQYALPLEYGGEITVTPNSVNDAPVIELPLAPGQTVPWRGRRVALSPDGRVVFLVDCSSPAVAQRVPVDDPLPNQSQSRNSLLPPAARQSQFPAGRFQSARSVARPSQLP